MHIGPTLIVAVSDPNAVISTLVPYVMLVEICLGSGVSSMSIRGERKEAWFRYACGSIQLREVCKST